jgi:hypothetical protein
MEDSYDLETTSEIFQKIFGDDDEIRNTLPR